MTIFILLRYNNYRFRQEHSIFKQHHYCHLKAHRVRGRNTENEEMVKGVEVAGYQGMRYVVLEFVHEDKHVIFNPIGEGKRKKKIKEGVQVFIAITV